MRNTETPFRTPPLNWKCWKEAASMQWVRPSSGQHPHTTKCGIRPAGPLAGLASGVLQHQRLQKHPTPAKHNSTWFSVRTREGHWPCHQWRVPSTARQRLATAHTVRELCPSPSPCSASAVGVPVPSFPSCLKEPQPCRHERLFPSPNHHLKATEQLHITVSTPICKASRAVCS